MKIAVLGATGFIGKKLIPFLEEKGHEVLPVGRDLNVPESEVVINLAGANLFEKRLTEAWAKEVEESRIAACRAITTKPKLFIQASGITPEGTTVRKIFDRVEEAANQVEAERTIIMRLSIVLARDDGAMREMLRHGGIFGDGMQKMAWIAIEDLLDAILFCIDDPMIKGTIDVAAPEVTRQEHFARRLERKRTIPAWLIRMVAGKAADELLLRDNIAAPDALKKAGFSFAFPNIDVAIDHFMT